MPIQTWTARFVVDHGRVTEEGGLLRSFPRRRMDEPDVDLHILAEPSGSRGADLGAQAIDNIGKLFLEDRLSLTGGLMRAVRSTHQTLQEWNRRSMPSDQVTAGLAAAIVNGATVYLMQSGPSLAYLRRDGNLQRLDLEEEALSPLGAETLAPDLRRIDLQAGDVLIAASEGLLSVADQTALEALLSRGAEEALPELYLLTKDLPDFALFAISCLESEPPAEIEEETTDEGPPAGDLPANQAQPDQAAMDLPARPAPEPFDQSAASPASAGRELPFLAPPPIDISRPIVRLRGGIASSRNDYARTTSRGGSPFGLSPRLLAMLGGAALVLFVGAFTLPGLIRENRGEKVNSLLENSQTQLLAAAQESQLSVKRDLLEESRSLAAEALRLEPENEAAAALREQAALQLDQLNAIFDLGPLTPITGLSQLVTGEIQIDSLVYAANTTYMLDGKGGRIIAVTLDNPGQPATVYQDGDVYGDTPAKTPLFMTWEGGDDGRLLVLDAERKLFALRPGALPESLPLRRTASWESVAGLATYDGNLYVLDPTGGEVHRYLTAASGFDSEPTNALSSEVDLTDAVSIAVNGDILILKRDGSVLRFRAGDKAEFGLDGIDRPLTGPTSIQVVGPDSELFITDTGNKRIVVASADGAFLRQYVSSNFTDLRAVAVDAISSQLYVVIGDQLLSAPLVR